MNKIPLAAAFFSALLFIACEKDRTCACTVTKTGNSTTTASFVFTIDSIPLPFPFPLPPLPVPGIAYDTTFTTPVNESYSADRKMEDVSKRTASHNCFSYSEPYTDNVYSIVPNFTLTTRNTGEKKYDCKLK